MAANLQLFEALKDTQFEEKQVWIKLFFHFLRRRQLRPLSMPYLRHCSDPRTSPIIGHCLQWKTAVYKGSHIYIIRMEPLWSFYDHNFLTKWERVMRTRICSSLGLRMKFIKTLFKLLSDEEKLSQRFFFCCCYTVMSKQFLAGLEVWELGLFKLVSCKPGTRVMALRPQRPEKLEML